jgi:hypothetical protein
MTMANKNLYERIQPLVDEKLKEYESTHGKLNSEEKARFTLIFQSLIFSTRIRRSITQPQSITK